jgi:hypothetical protein
MLKKTETHSLLIAEYGLVLLYLQTARSVSIQPFTVAETFPRYLSGVKLV